MFINSKQGGGIISLFRGGEIFTTLHLFQSLFFYIGAREEKKMDKFYLTFFDETKKHFEFGEREKWEIGKLAKYFAKLAPTDYRLGLYVTLLLGVSRSRENQLPFPLFPSSFEYKVERSIDLQFLCTSPNLVILLLGRIIGFKQVVSSFSVRGKQIGQLASQVSSLRRIKVSTITKAELSYAFLRHLSPVINNETITPSIDTI